jgi:hypothetical protein
VGFLGFKPIKKIREAGSVKTQRLALTSMKGNTMSNTNATPISGVKTGASTDAANTVNYVPNRHARAWAVTAIISLAIAASAGLWLQYITVAAIIFFGVTVTLPLVAVVLVVINLVTLVTMVAASPLAALLASEIAYRNAFGIFSD